MYFHDRHKKHKKERKSKRLKRRENELAQILFGSDADDISAADPALLAFAQQQDETGEHARELIKLIEESDSLR